MKILVTGGAGFIGRHVVAGLIARDHDVRVLDSFRPDVHRAMGSIDGVEVVPGDVRDRAALDAALGGVEAVITRHAIVGFPHQAQDRLPVLTRGCTAHPAAGIADRI